MPAGKHMRVNTSSLLFFTVIMRIKSVAAYLISASVKR